MLDQNVSLEEIKSDEAALFLAAVESLPEEVKPKKQSKKAPKKAVSEPVALVEKPVSKYAAKRASKADAPKIVSEAAPEVAVSSNLEMNDLFGDIFETVMGDEAEDLRKMEALRVEAYALMEKSKSMSARNYEKGISVSKQAFNLRMRVLFEAERMFYNDTKAKYFNTMTWDVIEAKFLKMQDAWHKRDGDPELKAKFQAALDKCIANYPFNKLADAHKANQEAAFEMEFELETEKAEQEKIYLEAVGKFDEANEIAKAHGWPSTTKKEKANGSK